MPARLPSRGRGPGHDQVPAPPGANSTRNEGKYDAMATEEEAKGKNEPLEGVVVAEPGTPEHDEAMRAWAWSHGRDYPQST